MGQLNILVRTTKFEALWRFNPQVVPNCDRYCYEITSKKPQCHALLYKKFTLYTFLTQFYYCIDPNIQRESQVAIIMLKLPHWHIHLCSVCFLCQEVVLQSLLLPADGDTAAGHGAAKEGRTHEVILQWLLAVTGDPALPQARYVLLHLNPFLME